MLFALLTLGVPCVCQADVLDDAARELAGKITATLAPGEAVVLNLRNLSSLTAPEVAVVRHALEAKLQSRGVRLVQDSASHVEIRVTLSENFEGYLWVAEFARGETPAVAMVALARPAAAGRSRASSALVIQKELVWEQEEPILDLALLDTQDGPRSTMLVLEPAKVSVYRRETDRWELWHPYSLPATRPWPRDLRGRIFVRDHSFSAQLPGMECKGDIGKTKMECEESTAPLGLADGNEPSEEFYFVAGRNFFTDRRFRSGEGGGKLPPFFSAAAVQKNDGAYWIFTVVDGRARLYRKQSEEPEAIFTGWGSEVAGIQTQCGSGGQVLATRPGDWTEPDAIRAYEIVDHDVVAVSSPVEFPGPVTALWPATDGSNAIAVVRNLKTEHDEAYRLSFSCGR